MNYDIIKFEDIVEGMNCIDRDNDMGTVTNCSDIHNIQVTFMNYETFGLYCLDMNCEDYEPLYYTKKDSRIKKLKNVL